jgi:hypothetical protein
MHSHQAIPNFMVSCIQHEILLKYHLPPLRVLTIKPREVSFLWPALLTTSTCCVVEATILKCPREIPNMKLNWCVREFYAVCLTSTFCDLVAGSGAVASRVTAWIVWTTSICATSNLCYSISYSVLPPWLGSRDLLTLFLFLWLGVDIGKMFAYDPRAFRL